MEDAPQEVIIDKRHECIGVGCRSWYCQGCMVGKALALREDLMKAVETFRGVFMLTLTIDPKIFKDARSELEYVQDKRCIAKLVAKLRKHPRCKLYSNRFFSIREFHQDGRVHYHVLLDAQFVPFDVVRDDWGAFAPKWYQQAEGDESPRFGSVRFTKGDFANRSHAARYVTKYLTKSPEHGFPAWVMAETGRIQRYTVSHRFWQSCGVDRGRKEPCPGCTEEVKHEEQSTCAPECFCQKCVGEKAPSLAALTAPESTIQKRVDLCCTFSVLLEIEDWMKPDGEELWSRRKYLGTLPHGPDKIAEDLGIALGPMRRRFTLRPQEARELLGLEDDAVEEEPGDKYDEWLRQLDNGGARPEHQQWARDREHAHGDHGRKRRTESQRTYNEHRHAASLPPEDHEFY